MENLEQSICLTEVEIESYKEELLAPLSDGEVTLTAVRDVDDVYFFINDVFVTKISKGADLPNKSGSTPHTAWHGMEGAGAFGFGVRGGTGVTYHDYVYSTDSDYIDDYIKPRTVELNADLNNYGTVELIGATLDGTNYKAALDDEVTVRITLNEASELEVYDIAIFTMDGIDKKSSLQKSGNVYEYILRIKEDALIEIVLSQELSNKIEGKIILPSHNTNLLQDAQVTAGIRDVIANVNGEFSLIAPVSTEHITINVPGFEEVVVAVDGNNETVNLEISKLTSMP